MSKCTETKQRYDAIDGLRAFSAIGIVLMHVLANGNYELDGFVFDELIPSFTDLVFLFMVISGFSMCCGYYDKIILNQISISEFYEKRFAKVWPFFAFLCGLDFLISPSVNSAYEVLANLTLCFGLIPNANISVIGVGWFLGLAFVFYLVFPFVCYLLSDKRRAWMALLVSLVLNFLCTVRFDTGRSSIVYSGVFFLSGGLIYLYRDSLQRFADKYSVLVLIGMAAVTAVYYSVSQSAPVVLILSCLAVVYALKMPKSRNSLLCNPVSKKLSGLSMEIYLCHMVIFRVIEKLRATHLLRSDGLSFAVTAVGTIAGSIVFSAVVQNELHRLHRCWMRKRMNGEET